MPLYQLGLSLYASNSRGLAQAKAEPSHQAGDVGQGRVIARAHVVGQARGGRCVVAVDRARRLSSTTTFCVPVLAALR